MTYTFHPAADLFPLMDESSEAFNELVQDIKANGLLTPIELLDQQILDGRNRYRACTAAGVQPRFEQWTGDSPYQHVASRNLHRRHLTPDQTAAVAPALKPKIAEEVDRKRRANQAATQSGKPIAQNSVQQGRNATANQLAKTLGTTRHKIAQAEAIAKHDTKHDTKLLEEVKAGTTTLHDAEKKVRAPHAPRPNGLHPSTALPGQWVAVPPAKAPVTLGSRLVDAVSKGRELPKLTAEIVSADVDLDDRTVHSLINRLNTEARERNASSRALKALLERRKSTA